MIKEIINGVVVLYPSEGCVITLKENADGAEPLLSTEVRLSKNDSEERYTEVPIPAPDETPEPINEEPLTEEEDA